MFPTSSLIILVALLDSSTAAPQRPEQTNTLLLKRIVNNQRTRRSSSEPVRIDSLLVTSKLTHRYASTLVCSRVTNPANTSQQIKFSVLLPESAFITGFNLEVGGKVYKSFVKEKQKAKHQYQQAVDNGLTAGHLAVSARDSNHFYVSVNVERGGQASFNLSYEQLLSRKLGLYSHVVNLHPGQIVPELKVMIHIVESHPLTKLSVLPFRSSTHTPDKQVDNYVWEKVELSRPSRRRAEIVFTPSAELQQQLSVAEGEGLAGQLITRYDVDNQPHGGTILVNEGYFVHLVTPSELPPLPKHVIYTLDVSGSMTGHKLRQLKEAMDSILTDLGPNDYFNIIEFSYSVTVWNLDSLSSSAVIQPELHSSGLWWFNKAELPSTPPPSTTPPPPPHSVPPYPATPEYIAKAKEVIDKMTAGGGTNIHGALKTAVQAAAESCMNMTANLTSPQPEPIIIFLTDGDPTIGITDTAQILSMVKELNVKQSAIFSLAFGDGADLSFLRRLSLANNGFARNIYEAADAALQLRNFYQEVASPLLANVNFSYPLSQVVASSVTSQHFHTLFLGSQLVVAGRLEPPQSSQLTGTITGLTSNGTTTYYVQSETEPIDELSADFYGLGSGEEDWEENGDVKDRKKKKRKGKGTLERMWAYLTIQQLLDRRHVKDSEEVKRRVLELALRYNFVTPMTSLVVVKPNQSVEIDLESMKPQSVRNQLYASNTFLNPPRSGPTHTKYEGTSSFMDESTTNKLITMDRLQNLTLADLRWLEGLVNLDNATVILPLGVNGSNQQYRLGLDQEDWPLGDCVSPKGESSHCRHLPHCVLPDILASVTSYIRYYCPLPNGYAGICCPDARHLTSTTDRVETTTGDTGAMTTEIPENTTQV